MSKQNLIRRHAASKIRDFSDRLLDGFLQLFAGAEGDLLAGLDLHRLPGLRIAAHPRFAPLYLKNSEPDDTNFVGSSLFRVGTAPGFEGGFADPSWAKRSRTPSLWRPTPAGPPGRQGI